MSRSKKQWPTLPTDEAAEDFVATADLSEYDWSAAEPVPEELEVVRGSGNIFRDFGHPDADAEQRKAILTAQAIRAVRMTLPHPGAFIRDEILDELGLSIAKAADILDVRRATLSSLVNEKARLSPEMALRIEKAFGVSMDTLLRMQAGYDTETMRRQADAIIVPPYKPARS